tara:strand:- start:131 stop:355 length:225 start_codon:yes stop_codon:yes gene_type:complete
MYSLITYKTQIEAILDRQGHHLLIQSVVTVICFVILAFLALMEAMSIGSAASFVEAVKQENKQSNETAYLEETT